MSNSESHTDKTRPFSVLIFLIIITTSTVLYLSVLKFVAPTVWHIQLQTTLMNLVWTTLVFHLGYAFFEYFFHRYIFHMSVIPLFGWLHKSHDNHHGHTRIIRRQVGVFNYFAIERDEQHENSYFPWFSFLAFALILTPFFAVGQLLFPDAPIFFGGIGALVLSINLYEILHWMEHQPNEKWDRRLTHPNLLVRMFWRRFYTFHLRHHADPSCNQGVGGFLGFRIPDWIFGTCVYPKTIYPHGTQVDMIEFTPPEPCWLIQRLDEYTKGVVNRRRQKNRGS